MPTSLLSFKPLVERYLESAPSLLSSHSFNSIFIWQDFFKFQFVEMDHHLCVFASDAAGTFLYLPPLAKTISSGVIAECFNRMRKMNKSSGVTRIENVGEDQLRFFAAREYNTCQRSHEYLYDRRKLVELKGDAFKSKRNAVNHFVKNDGSEYLPFESSMASQCAVLYDVWAENRLLKLKDDMHVMMIDDNRLVHRRVFENWQELGLIGRVVKLGGKIAAYTFGYFLNKETFCVLLEIADKKFKGLATYIFWKLSQDPDLLGTVMINVMDDLVPENVNRTKQSFRPAMLVPSYTITLKA